MTHDLKRKYLIWLPNFVSGVSKSDQLVILNPVLNRFQHCFMVLWAMDFAGCWNKFGMTKMNLTPKLSITLLKTSFDYAPYCNSPVQLIITNFPASHIPDSLCFLNVSAITQKLSDTASDKRLADRDFSPRLLIFGLTKGFLPWYRYDSFIYMC